MYCWGANSSGQLGSGRSGSNASDPTPIAVDGLKFVTVSAGQSHTCALTEDGQAYCWGENRMAQVGPLGADTCLREDATPFSCSAAPVPAADGLRFATIGAAVWHTCGLTTDGAAYCWGHGDSGRLGVEPDSVADDCPLSNSANCSLSAVRVSGGLTFVSLTVGGNHACGLTEEGQTYCWGSHLLGQLGDCSLRLYSSVVSGGPRLTDVAAENCTLDDFVAAKRRA